MAGDPSICQFDGWLGICAFLCGMASLLWYLGRFQSWTLLQKETQMLHEQRKKETLVVWGV